MNRLPVTAIDSDDSASDWDSTVAEAPPQSPQASAPVVETEGEYATVTPRPRTSLQGPAAGVASSKGVINGQLTAPSPRRDTSESSAVSDVPSPPPHMTSFQNSLNDYSVVADPAPEIPSRRYTTKGMLYTVPETEGYPTPQPPVAVNWDDSDAEEQVLKELQQNLERDRQRQQAGGERKITLSEASLSNGNENRGYSPSPTVTRAGETTLERWTRTKDGGKREKSPESLHKPDRRSDVVSKSAVELDIGYLRSPGVGGEGGRGQTVFLQDSTGKKCVFFFEEGSLHFLKVEDDEVNAYLPDKVDKLDKVFRRIWREGFSVLRIFTSFFVLMVLELVLYLMKHVLRPLVVDVLGTVGDHFLKPLFTVTFNAIIQPVAAFHWNIFSALYHAFGPFVKFLGAILSLVAIPLRAFRLFVFNWHNPPSRHKGEVDIV